MLGNNQADGRRMIRPKIKACPRGMQLKSGQVNSGNRRWCLDIGGVTGNRGRVRDAFDDDVCATVRMATTARAGYMVVIRGQGNMSVANTNLDLPDGGSEAAGEEQKSDKTGCKAIHFNDIRPGRELCKHAYTEPHSPPRNLTSVK